MWQNVISPDPNTADTNISAPFRGGTGNCFPTQQRQIQTDMPTTPLSEQINLLNKQPIGVKKK